MRASLAAILFCLSLLLIGGHPFALADTRDPFDPFSQSMPDEEFDIKDDDKSPEELLAEATYLLEDKRLLDARSKLLKILQKDPKEYRAHLMLSHYYMVHVGHFRLAIKYVRQAQNIFEEKYGKPPYSDWTIKGQHARILYLLSQARLNLDDYQGALKVLDDYSAYGYFQDWYPGSRAWILMKLGQLDEAIKQARLGLYADAEPGRTLNMLGILLSMTGDRKASIEVFKQAIAYELSMGSLGSAATPLNNIGEVYEEIFEEEQSKASYLRATKLPDGCEHVLPSLNLAKLYLDELNFREASRTMDSFEACVAKYPLRNGEEHRALVHLARGRVALHTGAIEKAIDHFRAALENRQWFGKIGTSEEDLRAGAQMSLAQALRARNNALSLSVSSGPLDWLSKRSEMARNSIEYWWLMRRTRQVLIEDLNQLEDLYIRNTDSMLEYPTFGEVLRDVETSHLESRLARERAKDARTNAQSYYDIYLAENYLNHGRTKKGLELLKSSLDSLRPRYDDALRIHALALMLTVLEPGSAEYSRVAHEIFALSRAALRNYGFMLPVRINSAGASLLSKIQGSAFLPDSANQVEYMLSYELKEGEHILSLGPSPFPAAHGRIPAVTIKHADIVEAVNLLTEAVFSIR